MSSDSPRNPKWSRWVRRICALVVALVAAYASYEHQRRFALGWGAEQVSAALWPLSVDGLVVLASVGLLEVNPTTSRRTRWSVRLAFLLGVVVSLLANIAAAPILIWQSIVVAGWPPVALLLAIELLTISQANDADARATDHSPATTDERPLPSHTRGPSVSAAVQRVLGSSATALTNTEIIRALRDIHGDAPEKRLRANVNNTLWALRRRGIVETRDGKNTLASLVPAASPALGASRTTVERRDDSGFPGSLRATTVSTAAAQCDV